jgi:hypothetical protein
MVPKSTTNLKVGDCNGEKGMRMRFLMSAYLCLVALPGFALGESFANLAEARKVSDLAVSLFREEKIVEGYGILKPYWPLPPVEIDNLANQTNMQWPMVRQRFGAAVGTEFVRERKVGESIAEYVYLQKFQHHAIRWVFIFYKPQDRWFMNSVSFDDNIRSLL